MLGDMRGIGSVVLGSALLLGAAVSEARVVDNPWGERCALAWCQDAPSGPVGDPLADRLAEAADRAEALAEPGCSDPGRWSGGVPATMILRRGGDVGRVRWTYPAPDGATVLAVCR